MGSPSPGPSLGAPISRQSEEDAQEDLGSPRSKDTLAPVGDVGHSDEDEGQRREDEETKKKKQANRLAVVFPGLVLCMFLAALDQTIIATALPTISTALGATPSQYSWVGTAYLLMTTTLTPCYGRLSDLIGRKLILQCSIIIFVLGSALCGAAQSMIWLIAARAVQGIGGGGIMSMSSIIVADIVPMKDRAKYQGLLGGVWGVASVLGPLLGGLLADRVSWRWCFLLNLPTCGVAFLILVFFLKIPHAPQTTNWREFCNSFDFPGLALLIVSLASIVVGFAQATDLGFLHPSALAPIIIGFVLFVATIVYFLKTKKKGILPRRIFLNRTTVLCLIMSYLQAFSFLSTTFYLPIFFQGVKGADALMSGVFMLPFSLLVSVVSLPTGMLISRFGHIRIPIRVGYAIALLGFGLMTLMDESSSSALNLIAPALVGIGIGASLQPPLILIQSAMEKSDMAASTSAFMLVRSLGATTGTSISGAILATSLRSRLDSLDGYSFQGVPTSKAEYQALQQIQPLALKQQVLHEFSLSLSTLFKVFAPFLGVCLILSMFVRQYDLEKGYQGKSEDGSDSSPAPPPLDEEHAGSRDLQDELDAEPALAREPGLDEEVRGREQGKGGKKAGAAARI